MVGHRSVWNPLDPMKASDDRPAFARRLAGLGPRLPALLLVILVLAWQANLFTPRIRAGETDPRTIAAGDRQTRIVEAWTGPRERRLVGAVVARARIELAPERSGRIERIAVAVGDRVEVGDVLAVLDDRLARAAVDRAEAALARARAEARGAERLLASIRAAAEARSIPRTEQIDAERARDAAARAVEEAQAGRAEAAAGLGFTRLESPVAGVVMDTLADPGDLASPGRPVLLLYRPDRMEVAVDVPASLAGGLAPGSELELRLSGADAPLTGTIRTLVRAADPATRSVLAKVAAPLPATAVPGLYVEARLSVPAAATDEASVSVPERAVERVRQLAFVHVVDDEGRVRRRLVRLGTRIGDRVLVHAGLRPGERILARAPARGARER